MGREGAPHDTLSGLPDADGQRPGRDGSDPCGHDAGRAQAVQRWRCLILRQGRQKTAAGLWVHDNNHPHR